MAAEQEPYTLLDLSPVLRSIMAARGLSVADMARMAGVSKSAMEKYLAGPSSPRAVAVASLARALNISTDALVFGEFYEMTEKAAHRAAVDGFIKLLRDLKSDPELSRTFAELEPGSDALSDFTMRVALDRADDVHRQFVGRHFRILPATTTIKR
ncbi:hypothetical protein BV509_11120 [Rhodovulum sulfidophilum]|uniref:Helix-turn-helix protein n=1 Tax=Rhodovulum visakhapatnamense TaxID=364297 RepID=A0A4R8FUL3_9RHOB|nr:helix-turn-helix transcriptional regulator [Rhodovulum visakhapatnamense]MBL3570922.1 helix-turn-helix transcriptional regulator [Rhodovulum visakhapatnamense]MBL3580135.1 helix-turn-helix transcriptional regulator [Rhodovulum visakhapatnamense]OLS44834.1 hypothetical protein BV509_11120 [Rhodovulum sulfidophilum]TDX30189.1 helix-turn-helix protein [Rhodovulum visakhapatnamense]